ncbi:M20 family metallopeptidase [Aliifodinibius sp. S!AR15-10]|uniref:M20 family metallopeptidase n=1 Tax=Aliifodinibius sp. S!AR15-10 TaxID=2950437 RepID=UPI00285C720B|nr:M20 family metallopeptidase [Aliifodinibius sp. S!AR15-10]MDR8389650.1 M20 family metallopeptidase [Aliifodinibius sp. S!AR15-10]
MVDQKMAKCILTACREEEEWFLDLLRALVRIETPPHEPKRHRTLLERLGKELDILNYRYSIYPASNSGGQLLARGPEKSPNGYQLMLGHIDTVWPAGTLVDMPFKQEDNQVCGPGIYDMKAGVVMILTALKVIQNLDLTPDLQPVLFINSDEETGSRDSKRRIRLLAKIMKRAYVLEPSLGPEGKIKTRRKGVGHFVIKVKGKSSHAGLEPEKGRSAILELSYLIQQLFELNDPENGITVNVGRIDGGIRTNVVAPESSADVDVRVLTKKDARSIEKAIRGLKSSTPGVSVNISGGFGREPMVQNKQNLKLWQSARDSAAVLDIKLKQGSTGGASDGNLTSQYTATLDGLGAVGEGAHSPNEKIFLEETIQRTALFVLLLLLPDLTSQHP